MNEDSAVLPVLPEMRVASTNRIENRSGFDGDEPNVSIMIEE